jgi:hypothetical protein
MLLGTELTSIGPMVSYSHPLKGEVFDVGRPWRFSQAPDDPARWPPVPGEDSRTVLEELGRTAEEIEQLMESGVVAQAENTTRPGGTSRQPLSVGGSGDSGRTSTS